MLKTPRVLLLITPLLISAMPAMAGAVRTFPGFQPSSLPKGDDISSPEVPLGFAVAARGWSAASVYVNTNGALTFHSPYAAYPGAPEDNYAGGIIPPVGSSTQAIISAFLADIDTSGSAVGTITYGSSTLNGRPVFVVNYENVTGFSFAPTDFDRKRNSFQIVLVERSDTGAGNFDIELNYDRIQWESADSNGGESGFGGYSAPVGFANGTGAPGTFYELPGSGVPGSFTDGAALSLVAGNLNSGVPGRYVFAIRNSIAPPTITSLSPSTTVAGGLGFTLTVNGSGFVSNSAVLWNGSRQPTTFVNAAQLTAAIPASLLASAGTTQVTVGNDGTISNAAPFTLVSPTPTISTTSPSTTEAGGSGFTLTLIGSGFAPGAVALWNGIPQPTTFVNASLVTVAIAGSLVASPGSATVALNMSGQPSNSAAFTITPAPGPSITSLSPASIVVGSAPFVLTLNGSGFAPTSIVFLSGSALPTIYSNPNQLTATVSTEMVARATAAIVTVSANGKVSGGRVFTVTLR